MSGSNSLGSIPVTVEHPKASLKLHWQRRAFQLLFIAVLIAIPVSGLLRIDPIAGAFVVLDHQIWWSDFFLVFGLWLLLASSLVLVYSTVGTAFCGWACPQNTLSEWANQMTQKLLGKRAEIQLDGAKMNVAAKKNTWLNWLVLAGLILGVSMVFALIPLLYFYSPEVIWSFVTFQDDARLAASLHYIYFIFVLITFIDVAFIRHFWCRFMCIYKVWQHGFKTKQTLHVNYDESRAEVCSKCNYCVSACFIGIDPRKTNEYDTCINCGECITACNNLQAKKNQPGLLTFKVGDQRATKFTMLSMRLSTLSSRVHWTLPFAGLGLAMFVWGLWNYDPYHLAVYRADTLHGAEIQDYRVAVSNKIYGNAELAVNIEGLNPDQYRLSSHIVKFEQAERIDLQLHINAQLPKGIHTFLVHVKSADGWQDSYRVQHFVGRS
ncbi:4Fe-4S binding protein [Kaarinaea lacus]